MHSSTIVLHIQYRIDTIRMFCCYSVDVFKNIFSGTARIILWTCNMKPFQLKLYSLKYAQHIKVRLSNRLSAP